MNDSAIAFVLFSLVVVLAGLLVGVEKYKEYKWRKAGGIKSLKIPDIPPPPEERGEDFQENNDEYDYGHNVSHHTLDGEGDL